MDDLVTERPGDFFLQLFDLVGAEFDHLAGIHVDDMVVMRAACLLKTRGPARKGVPVNRAALFQKLHRSIDGRQRNAAVDLDRPAENLQRVGVIFRLGQYVQDDPARPRDADACLAQFLFIIGFLVRFTHAAIMHCPGSSCKFLQLAAQRSPQPLLGLRMGAHVDLVESDRRSQFRLFEA